MPYTCGAPSPTSMRSASTCACCVYVCLRVTCTHSPANTDTHIHPPTHTPTHTHTRTHTHTHTHTQVEDELLRNVHHRVTCPKNQGQITSPERKAASRAINSHSLGGHAPSDGLGAGGGGGGGGGGGEAGNASILSAASPFAAPLSFINQVSKLFQQPPPQAGTAERPAAPASSSGRGLRASLASHELELHRASASAKCTSAVSSAAPAAAGSSLSADAVAWEEYENLKSVRLLRATRKVFVIHTMSHHHTYYVTSPYILGV